MIGRCAFHRREVLAGLVGVGVAGCASSEADKGKVLRVLSFEGYVDDPWIDAFEKKTGAKAKINYVYSVDEISAKMKASDGQDYDVIIIETSSYKRLIEQRLIRPIDNKKLPALGNLLPVFQDISALAVGGTRYGVPYAWGSIPLIYSIAAFPSPPNSWSVLWDPKYRDRVISLDDANNNIVTMAIALGFKDPFNLNEAQFTQIKAKLLEMKRNVITYYAGFDEGASLFAQGGVDLMLAMAEPQVPMIKKKGVDVGLTIPKEGAIGWIDCWAISAGVQDRELAHVWIDMMLGRDRGTYLSATHQYGNAVDEDGNRQIGLTYADKLIFLDAPEDFARRANLWNEVKATPV